MKPMALFMCLFIEWSIQLKTPWLERIRKKRETTQIVDVRNQKRDITMSLNIKMKQKSIINYFMMISSTV